MPLLLLLSAALATPDHSGRSDALSLLCQTADRAVFLQRSSQNNGTHYGNLEWVGFAVYDAPQATWTFQPLAAVARHDDMDAKERRDGRVTVSAGDASLGALLTPSPGTRCSAERAPYLAGWTVTVGTDGLRVGVGDVTRSVAEPRFYIFGGTGTTDPTPTAGTSEGSFPLDGSGGAACLLAGTTEVRVADRALLAGDVSGCDDILSAVVVDVAATALRDARRDVANQVGLNAHRAGDHDTAGTWFATATRVDPANTTVWFNLACAHARRGDVGAALRALRSIEDPAGLKERIAGDADFDGIREREELAGFVAGLP